MRGLNGQERAFLREQDRACYGGEGGGDFTVGVSKLIIALEGRGLLRWEGCPLHDHRVQHVTPTADGRTLLFVYETMVALYGGA